MEWYDMKEAKQKEIINKLILALLNGNGVPDEITNSVPSEILTKLVEAVKQLKSSGGMRLTLPKRLEMLGRILRSMGKNPEGTDPPIPMSPEEAVAVRDSNAMGSIAMSNMLRG